MPDFPKKLAILVLTKTLQVLSGFIVGFGFFRVSLQKSGSGFGLEKIVEVGFLSGSAQTRYITIYTMYVKKDHLTKHQEISFPFYNFSCNMTCKVLQIFETPLHLYFCIIDKVCLLSKIISELKNRKIVPQKNSKFISQFRI